jgi:cytochrome P450
MAWAWGTTENIKPTKVVQETAVTDEPHVELFDPHSGEWLLNKFETYKQLRQHETAYWSKKYQMYVITRYDDVMFALNEPEIFSSARGNLICEQEYRFGKTLGASDNPDHDILKDIVKDAYSKDNMQRIADAFAASCKELIKPIDNLNISEIIEDLSATVTAEIINPPFKKDEVKQYVKHIQKHYTGAVKYNTDNTGYEMFNSLLISMANMLKIPATGPGIYKEFLANNDPEKLHQSSLLSGPAISGASSLTGALEILTLDLFRENKMDIILADSSLIPNLINESLRFHASTGRFSRTVTKNVTLHGVNLEPGTRVALCLESANRDPAMVPDPDKFLLGRNTNGQVAFGHGVHACIALAICKKLMQVWVEQLLDLYGKYKVIIENKDLHYVITASGNDDMIANIYISTDK